MAAVEDKSEDSAVEEKPGVNNGDDDFGISDEVDHSGKYGTSKQNQQLHLMTSQNLLALSCLRSRDKTKDSWSITSSCQLMLV